MAGDRGRLTLPDLIFILMGLAYLGALVPVFYTMLDQNIGSFDTGTALLFQVFIPLLIIVFLTHYYVKAVGGR